MSNRVTQLENPRRGATLFVTLVVLAIIVSVSLLMARSFVALQAERRWQQRRVQAEYLAQAGLERAAARLAASPAYEGEVWKIASEPTGLQHPAEVGITLVEVESVRHVRVQAAYGEGSQRVVAVAEQALAKRGKADE